MPWIEALLRGQKVFAKVKAGGELDAESGRVEIRYKAGDGKAYRAGVSNLVVPPGSQVLPEETCSAAEFVGAGSKGATPTASAKSGTGTGTGVSATSAAKGPRYQAYTDGACSGNPGPAGLGVIVIQPNGKMHEGYEYLGTATNNIAELTAILRALEAMPDEANDILIHTDSQYAIGVLSKGWKPKVNQDLIAETKELLKARKAKLAYVPGHQGVPLNERADELAREAIRTRGKRAVTVA